MTYTDRPGSNGIFTWQADLVATVDDPILRDKILKHLNGIADYDQIDFDLIAKCNENSIYRVEDLTKTLEEKWELKDIQQEFGLILLNLTRIYTLTDSINASLNDFEDLYECLPASFFSHLKELVEKLYNIQKK